MSEVGSAIDEVRSELAAAASEFMPDLCDVVADGTVTVDGFGGTSVSDSVLATNVPCQYEAMTTPVQRQIGEGPITTLTHILTLPATAITKVIRPHYRIVVHASGDQPQLTFRNPVTIDGSMSVFTKLAAELSE